MILELLEFMSVEYIPAILVTHNDDDHFRGLSSILLDKKWGEKRGRIGTLYLVEDSKTRKSADKYKRLLNDLSAKWAAGTLPFEVDYLKRRKTPIFSVEINGSALELWTLAPEFLADASAETPNDSCGVVELGIRWHTSTLLRRCNREHLGIHTPQETWPAARQL